MQTTLISSSPVPPHWTHWGLSAEPFSGRFLAIEERDFVFPSASFREAVARITYLGQYQGGCGVLTGPAGCGKSIVLTHVTEALARVGVLGHVCRSAQEADTVAQLRGAGTPPFNATRDRPRVLLLDGMTPSTENSINWVDEVDFALTQQQWTAVVVAVSSNSTHSQAHDFRRLAPLVIELEPLTAAETAAYLTHRLRTAGAPSSPFSSDAASAIHAASQGVPRWINRLAHEALLLATLRKQNMIDATLIHGLLPALGLKTTAQSRSTAPRA